MNKQYPDLGFYLAEQAIKEYYRPQRDWLERQEVAEFCRRHKSLALYRTFLKLQRESIDRMVVEIILRTLPEDERQFFEYRYRDKQQLVWISSHLPISPPQLNRINRQVLDEIRTMLFYSLSPNDIFQRGKVINMLHIIDLRLAALSRKGVPVNPDFLADLLMKRKNCRSLLDIMHEYLNTAESEADDPAKNRIVSLKLTYPLYNVTEISQLSGFSKSSVSRKLRQYMNLAYKYVS